MAKNATETLSLSAFSVKHGVSRKTATRWRQAGLIVPNVGPVDVIKSEQRLADRPAQYRGGFAKGPHAPDETSVDDKGTLGDAKRIRSMFEALLAERRLEKLDGSLAAIEAAIDLVTEDHAAVRARLREVPAWLAPKLVHIHDAPSVHTRILKTFAGALHDVSKDDDEPPFDGELDDHMIPDGEGKLYYVDMDGECHYVRLAKDEPKPAKEPRKKRRRRSTPAVEAAIAETGAEAEVDQDLIRRVERALPYMSQTQARIRREVAEGGLKRAQYDLLNGKVVRVERIELALSTNFVTIKTNVLGIASKIAPRVAFLKDARSIEATISKELEEVIDSLIEPSRLVMACIDAS